MSEVKKIATRDSYGAALVELAKDHPDVVVLDADLAAATKTGVFKKAYPDRHFDCGIAESNMMATAAGMAAMGLVPFASSFAMFAAGRAFEQVRNSIGYPHLNVKIGATHGGISVGEDGASHQCCEDFALMRSIPGMTVLCPADDVEAKAAVKAAYEHEGPVYLRFGRLALPVFHDEATFKFEIGKGEQLTEGSDVAIIATGLEVNEALIAAEQLKNEGIQARVINLCTIKPLDEELVVKAAKECGAVVTCEEHSILGGLGEAVAAVLGAIPQCGFSAAGAALFSSRAITLGTLFAVLLSTSDEMLPLFIAEQVDWHVMAGIVGVKVAIGMIMGFAIDGVLRFRLHLAQTKATQEHNHEHARFCNCKHEHAEDHAFGPDHCHNPSCHCASAHTGWTEIAVSAVKHTLEVLSRSHWLPSWKLPEKRQLPRSSLRTPALLSSARRWLALSPTAEPA